MTLAAGSWLWATRSIVREDERSSRFHGIVDRGERKREPRRAEPCGKLLCRERLIGDDADEGQGLDVWTKQVDYGGTEMSCGMLKRAANLNKPHFELYFKPNFDIVTGMTYEILLYYKYATVRNPVKFMEEQRAFCEKRGLKGRIIVAKEGINGTIEGLAKDTKAYRKFLNSKVGFKTIHWKVSEGNGEAFRKLSVRVRPEIVSLSLVKSKDADVDPRKTTGKHLKPEMLKKWFDKGEKFTIIDMRNDYEHKVGAFEGSVLPPMENFRDLPKVMPKLKKYAQDKVLTVCTGGVRCEKASGYLIKKGFKDVYQLDGGIVSFMEKYPNEHFKGSLYVFDKRVTMAFDEKGKALGKEREIIGVCESCGTKTENFADCTNVDCRTQLLICADCIKADKAYCSKACVKIVAKAPDRRSRSVSKALRV
ncbi:MAG TPA: rhodanese-related sulfurtransferase [Candidatus Paceibacterota bacterium]